VQPPAGIEPATPSLPWNHQEPLCGPPFPQVTLDRQAKVIGSPSMKLCAHFSVMLFVIGASYPSERSANPLGVPCWVGHLFWRMASVDGAVWSSSHSVTAVSGASRIAAPSISTREIGIPRPATRR